MRRADLADLTAFVAVAETRSFRAAASRFGVTPSALSHTIRELEERLGVRLLNRTTRSVSPTDAGLRLLEQLRPALDQITGAVEDLKQERRRPSGRLRIYSNHVAAGAVIAPVWERFLSTYPDVHLEVFVDQSPADFVAKGFDAGIGPQAKAADMVAVRVMGPFKIAVVGAPTYFARHRPPRTPDDLSRQSCVQYRLAGAEGALFEWAFERDGASHRVSVQGRVAVNNPDLAVRAALDGLGIAYTTEGLVAPLLRSGQLVRVLEDWSPTIGGMCLYYPSHRQVPAALRAFIDMLRIARDEVSPDSSAVNPFFAA